VVNKEAKSNQAYSKLMQEARKKYPDGDIDVVNVTASGGFHLATIIPLFNVYSFLFGNFQYVTASGDVIEFTSGGSSVRADQRGVVGALEKASKEALKNVPAKTKIAIVYITAQDRSTTEYIAGELEYIWVNGGFAITDRSELDRLRREQDFQMSGEVDDATAVSIGKFAGARIIVTGRIDGEGDLRRLRLRAIDTQTTDVVGSASEKY
jgi:hypothetical protein